MNHETATETVDEKSDLENPRTVAERTMKLIAEAEKRWAVLTNDRLISYEYARKQYEEAQIALASLGEAMERMEMNDKKAADAPRSPGIM